MNIRSFSPHVDMYSLLGTLDYIIDMAVGISKTPQSLQVLAKVKIFSLHTWSSPGVLYFCDGHLVAR